MYTEMIQE